MDGEFQYPGGELEVFAKAVRWKAYWASQIRPFLGASVLEVGAGLGAGTLLLRSEAQKRWVALEPDPRLADRARTNLAGAMRHGCEVRVGTVGALDATERFDSILYIDVLEHIEDDRTEAAQAAAHLTPGGHLVILAPAHQWLFSPFDSAIGHWRRYTAGSLEAAIPNNLTRVRLRYLDAVGVAASAANRLLLHQPAVTARQIRAWDRLMVPASRVLDPLLGFSVGKSVLGIWRRGTSG